MAWVWHAACMVDDKFTILTGEPEQKKPSHRKNARWQANLLVRYRQEGLSSMGYY
jgi:hypothetical protein